MFVRFKDAYNENSANKTFPGVPETWRHVVAMRNSTQMLISQLRFKNDSFISERDLVMQKKQTFYYCFHGYSLGEAGLVG